MKDTKPQLFERVIDLEGRLRLPESLWDEYDRVVIGLGFGAYLHMYQEQVWMEFHQALIPNDILNELQADRYVRFHEGKVHLKMDDHGRVHIPLHLLEAIGIKPNSHVIGVGIGARPANLDDDIYYYRLYAKSEWLELNPANGLTLNYYKEHHADA